MSKKLEDLFENFMISEGRAPGKPSIKRYKRPDGTTALKSLNKWGKRKDWRDTEGGLAKAKEHAGVDEITEETGPSYEEELPQILKDIRGKRKSHSDMRREYGSNWKRLTNATSAEHGSDYNRSHLLAVGQKHMEEMNENFMDGKGPGKPGDSARHGLKGKSASELRSIRSSESASPRKKQLAHWLLNMHHNKSVDEGLKDPEDNPCWKGYEPVGTKKKNGKTVPNCVPVSEEVPCAEPISNDPNDPTSRLIGTDSIVKVYKKATPGQENAKLDESERYNRVYQRASAIIDEGVIEKGIAFGKWIADKAGGVLRRGAKAAPPRPAAPKAQGRLSRVAGRTVDIGSAAWSGADLISKGAQDVRQRSAAGATPNETRGAVYPALAGGVAGMYGGYKASQRIRNPIARVVAGTGAPIIGANIGYWGGEKVGAMDQPQRKVQESTDLNESYELAFDYQGKPQLAPTAGELRMQAKGAFAHHTDVQNVMDVKAIKESIQKQFELTVLEEDTDELASKCDVLMDMVEHALDTIAAIKESTVEKDAWAEAQILKLESYILSVSKYIDNILGEDSVPVIRRSYMRTDPRTGERKRVRGRTYKRRRDFKDDEDDEQDLPKGPLSV